ncbi:hypothetical protein D3C75_1229010 [compost metagenome]
MHGQGVVQQIGEDFAQGIVAGFSDGSSIFTGGALQVAENGVEPVLFRQKILDGLLLLLLLREMILVVLTVLVLLMHMLSSFH